MSEPGPWSEPDADGVRKRLLTGHDRTTLNRRRERLRDGPAASAPRLWPQGWKSLLQAWLGGEKTPALRRWSTLQKSTSNATAAEVWPLAEAMLRAGYLRLVEDFADGDWHPVQVEFIHREKLHTALGWPPPGGWRHQWDALSEQTLRYPALSDAAALLTPTASNLQRLRWLYELQRWADADRSGTVREFALFGGNDTKALSDSIRRWLDQRVDLASFGVDPHTPLLLLRAPLLLDNGLRLDAGPEFLGITPAMLSSCRVATGTLRCWRLVENRTSFEQVVRSLPPDEGVIWLPGFPPGWWQTAVGRLLQLAPAPAAIACDPDPAGIRIALTAGRCWSELGLEWQSWCMSADLLQNLDARKPLTATDRELLAGLMQRQLPAELAQLSEWMLFSGEKGEQEGYRLSFDSHPGTSTFTV